jgi:UDP-GlcNAc:undecaprenyl-phosphate/decaprenyl-phosphate GlcNAc-1-phosphate transferase
MIYLVFFLLSVFFSFLINWILLKFSKNLGVRNHDEHNQVRWSSETKPSLGGISFFILFLISTSVLNLMVSDTDSVFNLKMIGILSATVLGFVIGLADDAYNTNPLVKFMGQLSCAFILILTGVYIDATNVLEINYLLTVLWVVGLMNSINMLDNMDGITTSISMSIILVAIVFVAGSNKFDNSYLTLLLGVLGALTGFLYFNWNPAKIYMGDSGSQFLGVFLAAISMVFFWGEKDNTEEFFQIRQFVIPMLVFIVPLIDTTTVSIRRLMRGQSPFVGGKDHTTHHLVFFGLSEKQTAVTLLAISLISLPLSWILFAGIIQWTFVITLAAFVYFFVVFGLMQVVYNIGKKRMEAKKVS